MTFRAGDADDGSAVGTSRGDEQDALEGESPKVVAEGEDEDVDDDPNTNPDILATPGNIETLAEEGSNQKSPGKIQILDLHSENPIVSYDGQVYYCEWTRNIGTEMIFTSQDAAANLPALRHLPDGAVLLAASSARIMSKPLTLEPKADEDDEIVTTRKRRKIMRNIGGVQIDARASRARQSQASFLQRMMAIKQAKGEEDLVTLKVEMRKTNVRWRAEWKKHLAREKARVKQIIETGNTDEQSEAKTKLEEIKREEEALRNGKRKNRGGMKVGRKKKIRFDLDGEDESVPTPERWADLEGDGEGKMKMDEEGIEMDGDGTEGNVDSFDGLTDVDAPFEEDDDTPMREEW